MEKASETAKKHISSGVAVAVGGSPDADRFAHQNSFADAVAAAKGEDRWYHHLDWRRHLTWKGGYVFTSSLSFLIMAVFGALSIRVRSDCLISDPSGRCCTCLPFNTTNDVDLVDQAMPTTDVWNNVYYGIVMIVNSGFGVYYVAVGVRSENKYQLFCMLITQALEVARGLIDTILEKNKTKEGAQLRIAKEVMMFIALGLMVVSAGMIYPLYRQFGWTLFRKGGVKRSTRQMYKTYQRYRAFNRLDIQSSFLLMLIMGLYLRQVQQQGAWVLWVLLLCDSMASRYMTKFLKREDIKGVLCSLLAKAFVITWWIIVLIDYVSCYHRYLESKIAVRGASSKSRTVDFAS